MEYTEPISSKATVGDCLAKLPALRHHLQYITDQIQKNTQLPSLLGTYT